MTVAELEPLTIRSEGSSSNHYATLPTFFCGLHFSYNTYRVINPNQFLFQEIHLTMPLHLSYYAEEVVHMSFDVISPCYLLLVLLVHFCPTINNIKFGVLSRE